MDSAVILVEQPVGIHAARVTERASLIPPRIGDWFFRFYT